MSEPVRAQLIRSSVAVTRKPLSASSLLSPAKNGSIPAGGTRRFVGAGESAADRTGVTAMESVPLQRPLLPLVNEPNRQDREERHHRPEAEGAELSERHRPRKQERHF